MNRLLDRAIPHIQKHRRLLVTVGIVALVVWMLAQIPSIAQNRLQDGLQKAGFTHAFIKTTELKSNAIIAHDVKLDSYGFDTIATLKADIDWFSFFFGGNIKSLELTGLAVSRETGSLSTLSQNLFKNLKDIRQSRIVLNQAVIDLSTPIGDLRVNIDGVLAPADDGKSQKLKARITAKQYQLSFASDWSGTIYDDGRFDITGDVVDGRVNAGPFRIARVNGWISVQVTGSDFRVQSQIDSGSGTLFDLPLQGTSLIADAGTAQADIMFRTGISAVPDALITADYTGTALKSTFHAVMKGQSLSRLLTHIESVRKDGRAAPAILRDIEEFELDAIYLPERRFAQGPLPFSLAFENNGQKSINGNFLIYPDNMDVRGSIETTPAMAQALKNYFVIAPGKIEGNFIRLDGNVGLLFQKENATDFVLPE